MRALFPPLVAAAALLVGGCPGPADECTEEPAYGGLGNDEVWLTLRDAKDSAQSADDSPTVTSPENGAAFSAAGEAPTISWESPLKLALAPSPGSSGARRLHRRRAPSLRDALSATLIPAARAHLPPVSSDAYLVDIVIPGVTCPVSIVTTELSHPLDEGTWKALKDAKGEDLTLGITSAYLAEGRISEGPFKSKSVSFRVEE
jgi:hypothetical protein